MSRQIPDPHSFPWRLAAPSFVYPDTVAGNCFRLCPSYPEIALLFFQGQACLDYDESDLPRSLADLPLRYHVHMPLDLPWESGGDAAARMIRDLVRKAAFLAPHAYVVHAPPHDATPDGPGRLARAFREAGVPPHRVLLENLREFDPGEFVTEIKRHNFSICLDLGHMLAYCQEHLLDEPDIVRRTRMLHLNAPDTQRHSGKHLGLDTLDGHGRSLLRRMLELLPHGRTVVLELFDPSALETSLCELQRLCAEWRLL
jgi:sugar phosphate isomerase/epimerase